MQCEQRTNIGKLQVLQVSSEVYLSYLVWLGHKIRPTSQAGVSVILHVVLENLVCPSKQKVRQLTWGGSWVVTAVENEALGSEGLSSINCISLEQGLQSQNAGMVKENQISWVFREKGGNLVRRLREVKKHHCPPWLGASSISFWWTGVYWLIFYKNTSSILQSWKKFSCGKTHTA